MPEEPDKWLVPDILNWRMFGLSPQNCTETEIFRRTNYSDDEVLFRKITDWLDVEALAAPSFWLEEHTNLAGLPSDPRYIQHEHFNRTGEYIRSEFYYVGKIKNITSAGEMNAAVLQVIIEATQMIAKAVRFEVETERWRRLEKQVRDRNEQELLFKLKSGLLLAEGLRLRLPELAGSSFTDLQYSLSLFDKLRVKNANVLAFKPIPSEVWREGRFDRKSSSVVLPPYAYLLVRADNSDVSHSYLGDRGLKNTNQLPQNKRGRPSKNWGAIHTKALEIVQSENNIKKLALAVEIMTWYEDKFTDSIGEKTITNKLQEWRDEGFLD